MRRAFRTLSLASLMAAVSTVSAAAQPGPGGNTSVSVNAHAGYAHAGYSLGVWRDLSPRLQAGIEVGSSRMGFASGANTGDYASAFMVAPTLKLYGGTGTVRPFALLGVYGSQGVLRRPYTDIQGFSRSEQTAVGGRAALGLEWRPVSRLSVGGHLGLSRGYVTRDTGVRGREGWNPTAVTSGISVHLHF